MHNYYSESPDDVSILTPVILGSCLPTSAPTPASESMSSKDMKGSSIDLEKHSQEQHHDGIRVAEVSQSVLSPSFTLQWWLNYASLTRSDRTAGPRGRRSQLELDNRRTRK